MLIIKRSNTWLTKSCETLNESDLLEAGIRLYYQEGLDKLFIIWQATQCSNSSFQMCDILELDYNML